MRIRSGFGHAPSGRGGVVSEVRYYPQGVVTKIDTRKTLPESFDTRAEAEEEAEILRAHLISRVAEAHPGIRPSAKSFRAVLKKYVEELDADQTVAKGTRLSYQSTARVYLGHPPNPKPDLPNGKPRSSTWSKQTRTSVRARPCDDRGAPPLR